MMSRIRFAVWNTAAAMPIAPDAMPNASAAIFGAKKRMCVWIVQGRSEIAAVVAVNLGVPASRSGWHHGCLGFDRAHCLMWVSQSRKSSQAVTTVTAPRMLALRGSVGDTQVPTPCTGPATQPVGRLGMVRRLGAKGRRQLRLGTILVLYS